MLNVACCAFGVVLCVVLGVVRFVLRVAFVPKCVCMLLSCCVFPNVWCHLLCVCLLCNAYVMLEGVCALLAIICDAFGLTVCL